MMIQYFSWDVLFFLYRFHQDCGQTVAIEYLCTTDLVLMWPVERRLDSSDKTRHVTEMCRLSEIVWILQSLFWINSNSNLRYRNSSSNPVNMDIPMHWAVNSMYYTTYSKKSFWKSVCNGACWTFAVRTYAWLVLGTFFIFHILVMLSLTQAESGGLLRVIMEDHMVGS